MAKIQGSGMLRETATFPGQSVFRLRRGGVFCGNSLKSQRKNVVGKAVS